MLALLATALALSLPTRPPPAAASRSAVPAMDFHRGADLFGTGPFVTESEVVNVLGRWTSYRQWNEAIGGLPALDKLEMNSPWSELVVDGRTGKLRRPANEAEKEMRTPARSPQRRQWCQKRGLAQR